MKTRRTGQDHNRRIGIQPLPSESSHTRGSLRSRGTRLTRGPCVSRRTLFSGRSGGTIQDLRNCLFRTLRKGTRSLEGNHNQVVLLRRSTTLLDTCDTLGSRCGWIIHLGHLQPSGSCRSLRDLIKESLTGTASQARVGKRKSRCGGNGCVIRTELLIVGNWDLIDPPQCDPAVRAGHSRGTCGTCFSRGTRLSRRTRFSRRTRLSRRTCLSGRTRRTHGSRRSNDLGFIRNITSLVVCVRRTRRTLARSQVYEDLTSRDEHELTHVGRINPGDSRIRKRRLIRNRLKDRESLSGRTLGARRTRRSRGTRRTHDGEADLGTIAQ